MYAKRTGVCMKSTRSRTLDACNELNICDAYGKDIGDGETDINDKDVHNMYGDAYGKDVGDGETDITDKDVHNMYAEATYKLNDQYKQ